MIDYFKKEDGKWYCVKQCTYKMLGVRPCQGTEGHDGNCWRYNDRDIMIEVGWN